MDKKKGIKLLIILAVIVVVEVLVCVYFVNKWEAEGMFDDNSASASASAYTVQTALSAGDLTGAF